MNLLFLLLTAFSFSKEKLADFCQAEKGSCAFYTCAENFYDCGSKGYFRHFAKPYCENYFQKVAPKLSSSGKRWLERVAHCLQAELADRLDDSWSCRRIKKFAIGNHSQCYVKTGFCRLKHRDQRHVIQFLLKEIWKPEIIKEGFQVMNMCRKRS